MSFRWKIHKVPIVLVIVEVEAWFQVSWDGSTSQLCCTRFLRTKCSSGSNRDLRWLLAPSLGSWLNRRGFPNYLRNDAHVILVSESRRLVEAILQKWDSSGWGGLSNHRAAIHQTSQACMCLTGHVTRHTSQVVHAFTYIINVLGGTRQIYLPAVPLWAGGVVDHINLLLELRAQVGRPCFGSILLKLSWVRVKCERLNWCCNC